MTPSVKACSKRAPTWHLIGEPCIYCALTTSPAPFTRGGGSWVVTLGRDVLVMMCDTALTTPHWPSAGGIDGVVNTLLRCV